jgi:short subunit dehydrogenase-like uncharacterized protein
MADIVLFGATGYTGKLTARALHERGVDMALAGRDPRKLAELAEEVGDPQTIVVDAGDVDGLTRALEGARVLITCVGPFAELGWAAVEAALRARVHYLDSTGEGTFVGRLLAEADDRARDAGIAMAPAMGFDEVPADVVCSLATEGLERPTLDVTYALPRTGSTGTVRTSLAIMRSEAPYIVEGETRWVHVAEIERWSPMPEPLGPRRAVSFPFALLRLAPRHIDLASFGTYVTMGNLERGVLRRAFPLVKLALSDPARSLFEPALRRRAEGPDDQQRSNGKWTILAEARSGDRWRNVTAAGTDVYGLTAATLSRAALEMSSSDYSTSGVVSPVQAVGLDVLTDELEANGVRFDTYAPV